MKEEKATQKEERWLGLQRRHMENYTSLQLFALEVTEQEVKVSHGTDPGWIEKARKYVQPYTVCVTSKPITLPGLQSILR